MTSISTSNENNLSGLRGLPPVVEIVYLVIRTNKSIKFKKIRSETGYSERRIREAIKILVNKGYIEKIVDFNDLRSYHYQVI